MKLNRIGLSIFVYILFPLPNGVLADEKTDAYYWSGSIAAVCNLYKNNEISKIDAKSYMNKIFPIIDKLPSNYKDLTYTFLMKLMMDHVGNLLLDFKI